MLLPLGESTDKRIAGDKVEQRTCFSAERALTYSSAFGWSGKIAELT